MYMRNSNNRNNKTHKTTHNKQNYKKWKQENYQSGTANKIKCRQWGKNMRIKTKIQKKIKQRMLSKIKTTEPNVYPDFKGTQEIL